MMRDREMRKRAGGKWCDVCRDNSWMTRLSFTMLFVTFTHALQEIDILEQFTSPLSLSTIINSL